MIITKDTILRKNWHFFQGAITLVLWYGGKLVHDRSMNVGELTGK